MSTRIGMAALLLAALAFTGSSAQGSGDDHGTPGGGSGGNSDCEFVFKFHNPPRVHVVCEPNLFGHNTCFNYMHGHVNVRTNACTRVVWRASDFERKETDCDGNPLTHTDRVAAHTCIGFAEVPLCNEGAPLKVKDDPSVAGNSWPTSNQVGVGYPVPNSGAVLVDSHRGGYYIAARVFPATAPNQTPLCADNGCYTSKIRFWVTTIPNENCDRVPGMDTFSTGPTPPQT